MLACTAFRQPISQAEIGRLFGADKRGLVVKLRDIKLVEEFAGADGRLRFATTEAFLQRFGLASLQELTAAPLSDKAPIIQPTGNDEVSLSVRYRPTRTIRTKSSHKVSEL